VPGEAGRRHRGRPGVPVLPFLAMVQAALVNDVVVSQLVRAKVKHPPPLPRLSDLAGLSLFHLSGGATLDIAVVVALDWYA
jgi:hypothetical protein